MGFTIDELEEYMKEYPNAVQDPEKVLAHAKRESLDQEYLDISTWTRILGSDLAVRLQLRHFARESSSIASLLEEKEKKKQ